MNLKIKIFTSDTFTLRLLFVFQTTTLLVYHVTRYAYILTSKTQNANDFIKLVQKVTQDYKMGLILTDQYPGINSKDFKLFLQIQNIPSTVPRNADVPTGALVPILTNYDITMHIRSSSYLLHRKYTWANSRPTRRYARNQYL